MEEVKTFLKVLLVAELFVIIFITIPIVVTYGFVQALGIWGYLVSSMTVLPWLSAWTVYIRNAS